MFPCLLHWLNSFQSTLPYGSDAKAVSKKYKHTYFNPRSLTGATRSVSSPPVARRLFQSTLPYGSDMKQLWIRPNAKDISIHAPLRERQKAESGGGETSEFQSTLPYGSDGYSGHDSVDFYISIHAPLRERLKDLGVTVTTEEISIHAPLRERHKHGECG